MPNQKTMESFNQQINEEIFSSYLYLSMAAYFESKNLKGMAHWMRLQTEEENMHAMKFFDFVLQRGGKINLSKIEGPKTDWASPLEAFEDSYKHEEKITSLINNLVDLSLKEKDHAANAFLQWFVTEQVEEEANVLEIVEKLKLAGDHPEVLLMIDKELSQRTLTTTPAPNN